MRIELQRGLFVSIFFVLLVLMMPSVLGTIADHVVISEIKTNTSGEDEFVELYNPTSSDIQLDGWKLTRNNSAGTPANLVNSFPIGSTIPAHGYFLIAHQDYTGLVTADIDYSANNPITDNYAALLYNGAGDLVDGVGWGSSLEYEGTATSNPLAGQSIERKSDSIHDNARGNGLDTDDNSADFQTKATPEPQNSESCKEGTTLISVGSSCEYITIQAAIDASIAGDTINVSAETYPGDLSIPAGKDNLVLAGADKTTTTIKGVANVPTGGTLAIPNIEILADGVIIHGFTIEGPDRVADTYSSGIVLDGQNIEIYDNDFITTAAENTAELAHAITTYSKAVMPTADVSGLNIYDNTFTGSGAVGMEAIYINPHTGVGTITINNNQFSGRVYTGMTIESGNADVTNNVINGDIQGIYGIRFMDTTYAGNYNNILISGNDIQNAQRGIRIGNGGDGASVFVANILSNTLSNNDVGIWTRKGSQVTATSNSISGNIIGIQNDIITSVNAENNWWGHETGPYHASNLNGLGDSVSDNVDYYPWIEYTLPQVSILTPSNNEDVSGSINVTVNVIDTGIGVQSVAVQNGTGGNFISMSLLEGDINDGDWSAILDSFDILDGSLTLRVNATDFSGNSNTSESVTVTVDNTPPQVTQFNGNVINNANLSGTKIINVSVNDATTNVDFVYFNITNSSGDNVANIDASESVSGFWNATLNTNILNDGTYNITAYANDTIGNLNNSEKVTITIDNTNPQVSFISPISGQNVSGNLLVNVSGIDATTGIQTLRIQNGTVGNWIDVFLQNGDVNNGDYSFNLDTKSIPDGPLTLSIDATDFSGNSNTSESVTVAVDNTAPTISSLNKTPEPSYNDNNVMLNATINDALSSVDTVLLSGNWTGSWQNISVTNVSGLAYNYTIDSSNFNNQDIVGYVWYANDTLGNINSSLLQTFQVANRAPVSSTIPNVTWPEDTVNSSINLSTYFTDVDGDTLTFSSTTPADISVSINQLTGIVTLNPNTNFNGTNFITFSASDGIDTTFSNQVTLNVTNVNDAPNITSFFPTENKTIAANVGSQEFNVTFTDVDIGDIVTASWFSDGTFLVDSSNVTVSGLSEGIYNITVIVTDILGESARNEWLLNVTSEITGDGLTSNVLDLNETERQSATNITVSRSTVGSIDFGNEILDFRRVVNLEDAFNISDGLVSVDTDTYPELNKSASLVMEGLTFSKTPWIFMAPGFESTTNNAPCPTTICSNVVYNATTGFLSFDVSHFTTFFPQTNTTNGPPTITSIPVTRAAEGSTYSYNVRAIDLEGDTLTFSLITSPSGMSISSSSGLISWTPLISQLGINDVTVSVSDDGNLTDSQSFQINVSKGSKLIISDLDILVDGKTDRNVQNNTKIRKEVKPGSDVEFKIEIKNRFTKEENLEIEDIEVQVTIEDIDDGDDLEEESNGFDLDWGDDDTVKIEFNIPLEIDEDIFDVIIYIEGEDDNGTTHTIKWILELEVEKDKHDIIIRKLNLNPTSLSCTRAATLDTGIINLGRNDEDRVTLEISNQELGINFRQEDIELKEGTNENTYEKALAIRVRDSQEAGIYPITANVYYDDNILDDSKTIDLNVQDCERAKEEKEFVQEDTEIVQVIRPPHVQEIKPTVTDITFRGSDSYFLLLTISFVLLSGLAIFLAGAAIIRFKK